MGSFFAPEADGKAWMPFVASLVGEQAAGTSAPASGDGGFPNGPATVFFWVPRALPAPMPPSTGTPCMTITSRWASCPLVKSWLCHRVATAKVDVTVPGEAVGEGMGVPCLGGTFSQMRVSGEPSGGWACCIHVRSQAHGQQDLGIWARSSTGAPHVPCMPPAHAVLCVPHPIPLPNSSDPLNTPRSLIFACSQGSVKQICIDKVNGAMASILGQAVDFPAAPEGTWYQGHGLLPRAAPCLRCMAVWVPRERGDAAEFQQSGPCRARWAAPDRPDSTA